MHNEKMAKFVGIFLCLITLIPSAFLQEQTEHRDFQYNSVVDPITGRYNFAYDTGNDNDIAHSLHMQYQDADGIVRGRYGYTDPNGKLRMVEYEAGPDGFIARGDVGPDQFPHGQAPAPTSDIDPSRVSSYSGRSGNDFDLDPAPVQMAGWDPEANPMNQPQTDGVYSSQISSNPVGNSAGSVAGDVSGRLGQPEYANLNVTSNNALELYGPELGFLTASYPPYAIGNILSETTNEGSVPFSERNHSYPVQDNNNNIYSGNPASVQQVASDADQSTRTTESERASLVRRSGDRFARYDPVRVLADYSYYPRRQTHDHDAERRYYSRQTHDHEAERRYYAQRTHDHDAERRYYSRQSQNHNAEVRSRLSHDHNMEGRYRGYHNHAHDRAAERDAYYRRAYGRYYPRRIFYRDSHSWEPHEHYDNPVYRNYRAHGHYDHSDVHLSGRS